MQFMHVVLMAAATWSPAQAQPRPDSSTITDDKPLVQVAGQMDLSRLVDLCADRIHERLDYDPTLVRGSVTLRVGSALNSTELWQLTNLLLAQRGLTTVRVPGVHSISVVKIADAAALAGVEPPGPGGSTPELPDVQPTARPLPDRGPTLSPGFSTIVVAARFRPAKELAESIRPLLAKPSGAITVLGDSRLLLISDLTPRLDEISRLLDLIDTPSAKVVIEEISLRNVLPSVVATSVTQMATKRDQLAGEKLGGEVLASPNGSGVVVVAPEATLPGWRELISRFDQREAVERRTYSPKRFAAKEVARLIEQAVAGVPVPGGSAPQADDRWRLVVDELTGSLIITATASQHVQIEELVSRLDSAEQAAAPMRSYVIRNRPVQEVLDTLSKLIDAGALDSAASDQSRAAVTAGADQQRLRATTGVGSSPLLPQGGSPSTAGSSGTSSGSPTNPPQSRGTAQSSGSPLRLTADEATNTLIAVGEPRLLSQVEALLAMIDVRQPQVMLDVTLVSLTDSEALSLGVELERLATIGDARLRLSSLFGLSVGPAATRAVGDAAGFTGAVLSPGEFSVVVKALESLNRGRSQSNPKVLVTNNERAVFSSTLQQPLSVRTESNANSVSTSYGGSDSAGTTISVRPQIAQGDHLVLTYSIKLSSFVGNPSGAGLPPPKQENSVDSVATIPDGHTVVVGGLELITNSEGTSQVPLIGRIPLLGELFKDRSRNSGRTRFFVFLRATVLRSNQLDDLKYLSLQGAKAMGVHDGFPEVRPRVIR